MAAAVVHRISAVAVAVAAAVVHRISVAAVGVAVLRTWPRRRSARRRM
jgi:hypothetical protein